MKRTASRRIRLWCRATCRSQPILEGAVRAATQERGNNDPLHRYNDPLRLHVTGMVVEANTFVRERMLANAAANRLPAAVLRECAGEG